MRFYDDIVYDREYNGLVLDDDEGQLRQILPLLCSYLHMCFHSPWALLLQCDAVHVRIEKQL